MNMKTQHHTTGPDDQTLEKLFSHANSRARPPAEDEATIRAAVEQEWRAIARPRNSRRNIFAYSAAASILLALAFLSNWSAPVQQATPLQQVAVVEKQSGNIYLRARTEAPSVARRLSGDAVFTGQVLSTSADARLALNWEGGESIRMDEGTELAFNSSDEIELLTGRIYIDSRRQNALTSKLAIRTASGLIQHLGTQYVTGVNPSGVVVIVREGRVRIAAGQSESIAEPGQQVNVDQSGIAHISQVPIYGDSWLWTELVTPEFNLDGLSAFDFLNWAGRETGRAVQFESDQAELLARKTTLRGSIDLEPNRALDLILQTSDLDHVIENGNIRVRIVSGG